MSMGDFSMMTIDSTAGDGDVGRLGRDSAAMDVYDDIAIELRRVLKLGRALTYRQMRTFNGVAPALFSILSLLYREGPKRTTTVAEHLHIDVSVASRQVGELEHIGQVERRPDPSDARAYLMAITASGTDTVLAVREQQRQITRAALDEWDSEELRAFVIALRRFGDDMTHGVLDSETDTTTTRENRK